MTIQRLQDWAAVFAKGPVVKIILFSGESGSMPGFSSSKRIFAAIPLPPIKSLASSSGSSSIAVFPVLRLILRIFHIYPLESFSIIVLHVLCERLEPLTQF